MTTPERIVFEKLSREGIFFEVENGKIFGRPDFYVPNSRTVIFVDGCFWHAHSGCHLASLPRRNAMEWLSRFNSQKLRDETVTEGLASQGFRVLRIWECEVAMHDMRTLLSQ